MICFYLFLWIILDLSYIVKWFLFVFCVVIKNVVFCNLYICNEEKKMLYILYEKLYEEKIYGKEIGWNFINFLIYVNVIFRCVLKFI